MGAARALATVQDRCGVAVTEVRRDPGVTGRSVSVPRTRGVAGRRGADRPAAGVARYRCEPVGLRVSETGAPNSRSRWRRNHLQPQRAPVSPCVRARRFGAVVRLPRQAGARQPAVREVSSDSDSVASVQAAAAMWRHSSRGPVLKRQAPVTAIQSDPVVFASRRARRRRALPVVLELQQVAAGETGVRRSVTGSQAVVASVRRGSGPLRFVRAVPGRLRPG
jgi:hypothetical protein